MTDVMNQYGAPSSSGGRSRSGAQGGQDANEAEGGESLNAKAGQVRRVVADKASAAKDWANERASVARDWASDQTDTLRDTVQTKPFVAVGVSAGTAFAAGLVLGILLARR